MKYKACRLISTKNYFHAQDDACYIIGYKLTIVRDYDSSDDSFLERWENIIYNINVLHNNILVLLLYNRCLISNWSSKGPRGRCLGLRFIYRKGLKVAKQDGGRKNLTLSNKVS